MEDVDPLIGCVAFFDEKGEIVATSSAIDLR
jgi:hypothetical protein